MKIPKHEQALRLISPAPLSAEVNEFLADCQARNLSVNTIRIYRNNLRAFITWGQGCITGIDDAQMPGHLRAYMLHLQATGHNPGGRHQAFRTLRTFFRWLQAEGLIDRNPMQRLKPPKLPDEELAPIPLPTIKAMLNTCDKTPAGERDRAIILALLDTGCRAAEFVDLNLEDANLETGALKIRQGKGRKFRVVFLGARARRALLHYLRYRGQQPGPLFQTLKGERLSYPGLRQIMRRRAERAGIAEPPLHGFRRTFAILSLRNGVDLVSLQKLLGHADLSILRRYLSLTTDDLQAAHQKGSPVDRMF